jgi:thiamine transport system permease protein
VDGHRPALTEADDHDVEADRRGEVDPRPRSSRIARRPAHPWTALAAVPPLAFLALFFLWPVIAILALGLAPGGSIDLEGLWQTWSQPFVLEVAWFTLWLAGISTILTLLVGLPGAWALARFSFPGRSLAWAVTGVPFVLPTVVVGAAFLALLGPRGALSAGLEAILGPSAPLIRLDGTLWAILIAHVFYNVAVVIRVVGGLWAAVDPRTEEAARVLGASGWRAFREVTLPLLRPAILSAASIVFLFTATSFGVVLLLGGPAQTTLEVEIWRQTAVLLDLRTAAALTLLQLVGILALLLVSARAQERLALTQRLRPAAENARAPRTRAERLGLGVTLAGLGMLLVVPLAVLVERSLAVPGGHSLAAFAGLLAEAPRDRLFVAPLQAIGGSLVFAFVTMLLAGTLGLLAAVAVGYRRGWLPRTLDALVMLPLGTSSVALGFGILIALDEPPLDLRTSVLIIPVAHTLVALPFVLRAAVPVVRSIDHRMREAASVLGASPARTWVEVDGPVIARAALIGAGFAFAVSLGEFGATLFLARPDTPTIPLAIYRLLGQPGAVSFASAMALSVVLMVLTAGAVLGLERIRGSAPRGF